MHIKERMSKRLHWSFCYIQYRHGGNDAQKVMGIIMAALIASDPSKYSLIIWWVPFAVILRSHLEP
jgi:phosphate/sulfate permease